MQKNEQNGSLNSCQNKRGILMFFSTMMIAGIFFISGNIKTIQAAGNYTDDCLLTTPIGDKCGGGIKYAQGYVAMPGGCADSTNNPTCSGTDNLYKAWSAYDGVNEPADSLTDGMANTKNLLNNPIDNGSASDSLAPDNPSALYCFNMISNGKADWYLPAKNELDTLYGQRVLVGGFDSNAYWSSTEDTTSQAWVIYFNSHQIADMPKHYNIMAHVRCIRKVSSALTYTAGANGNISGTSSQTVSYGDSGTQVMAVPNSGYSFVNWSDGSTANPRTDTSVTTNISVTANFAPFVCGTGAVLDADANSYNTVLVGTQCWMASNMRVGTRINGTSNQTNNSTIEKYCYSNIAANCDTDGGLYQWDEAMQYSTTEGAQGICPTGFHVPSDNEQYILENYLKDSGQSCDQNRYGNDCTSAGTKLKSGGSSGFNAPLAGINTGTFAYRGAYGTLWSSTQGGNGAQYRNLGSSDAFIGRYYNPKSYSFSVRCLANPTPSYTLTYVAGSNGTLSGSTPQTVTQGASGTAVTAVPATGYHFANWSDNSTDNPRTDTNVQGNISVTANFAINTYTLTYTAGSNGTISGIYPQTVNYNASGTAITANPSTGYHFVNWSDASTQNPRTDTNVQANKNVTANFAINNYTVTFNRNGGDTEASPTTRSADHNTTVTLPTAPAKTGYVFTNWNTQANGSGTTFTSSTAITNNLTVYAQWSINSYSLTYSANPHGSITGTTSQTVNYNNSGTQVTAIPSANYHFTQWSDGGLTAIRTDSNVQANKSVTASFALNDQTIDNPTPQKLTAAYNLGAFTLADGTSTSTSKATTTTNLTLTSSNTELEIPINTQITKTNTGNLDITALTTQNITSIIQETVGTSKAAVKIGIPNVPLTFSQDVTINLTVPSSYNNETLTIYTRQDNATDWTKETTCLVTNSICSFTTRHATEFTANFEVSNSPDPTHVNMDINSTITIDCKDANSKTYDYIAMNPITGTGKSTPNSNNDVSCNVITNNSSGYTLSFASSTPEMKDTTGDTIVQYTPTTSNTPEAWSVSSADSEWGARLLSTSSTYDPTTWGTIGTDDYTTKWYSVTNQNSFILSNRSTETAQSGDDQIIRFGAEIGASKFQPTGTYTDNVTFTAVTNN